MTDSDPEDMISWGNLVHVADFLAASGERSISLLGGEPALHPRLVDYIIYFLERDFHITIFTSGIMSERVLGDIARFLPGMSPERVTFVCNLNDPSGMNFAEQQSVERFLAVAGPAAIAGFNIWRPDFSIDFILDYINRFGLRKGLRLGIANPIPGVKNAHLSPDAFPAVIDRLLGYAPSFEAMGIRPGLDCGFTLCSFSDEAFGKLYKAFCGNLRFTCGPAIDIGPDLSVWSCFPLSTMRRKSLLDFDNLKQVIRYYEDYHAAVRVEAGGIFDACDTCRWRARDLCSGGCLGHILSELREEEPVRAGDLFA
jgi:hypothetical protein